MNTIKISQLAEKEILDGYEYIPVQHNTTTYKISVDSIIQKSKETLNTVNHYTYDELKQLKDSNLLEEGEVYAMTDYQCIYKQPVSEEIKTSEYDGWILVLTAISSNQFAKAVEVYFTEDSTYVSNGGNAIINCEYIFDDFAEYEWSTDTSKGVIVSMTDANNNSCSYDFKHIKFRRWALKDVTENDTTGTSETRSAYRCYGSSEEPARSDSRSWVGSGLEIEKDYIKSIFAGTFPSVMWEQDALHEDYITYVHKPFKAANRTKYAMWSTDTSNLSDLSASVPGLLKITLDEADYIDAYTFDWNGIDFSNLTDCDNNIIRCQLKQKLPNTVFVVDENITEDILNVHNNSVTGQDNTFAMHIYPNCEYEPVCSFNDFEYCRNNIFQFLRFYYNKGKQYTYCNYLAGSWYKVSLDYSSRSVYFGYFNSINANNSSYNLLFGEEMRIINSNGEYVSPADGNYWYDNTIQEWFGYNVMAPFQYSVFYPHTNTNFVRLPYNKGVTLMGTFQDNFVDRMRWGVTIEYGAVQGNYLGTLQRTTISPSAFVSNVLHNDSFYTLEGATKLQNICNTRIAVYQANVTALMNNLSDSQKTMLSESGSPKLLTLNGTVPQVKYWYNLQGDGSGVTNYDELTNKPSINGIPLVDDVTLDELNIQQKIDVTAYALKMDLNEYATKEELNDAIESLSDSVYDLSKHDIYGNVIEQTTANCYIVNKVGTYKFPLVYGNAIKNGATNSAAYTKNSGSNSHDFVTHYDSVITTPYIEDLFDDVSNVQLSIADTDNVFTNFGIIEVEGSHCRYVQFDVTVVPATGANGVISVKTSGGIIVWNWHIWVWNEDMTTVPITNATGVTYNILPYNLASKWDSGSKTHIKNWYYQFGRPNPMLCPRTYDSGSDHASYGALSQTSKEATSHLCNGIMSPTTFYEGTSSTDYVWFNYNSANTYNLWDANCTATGASDNDVVKTVYDPSPIGFKIPNGNTFTGFSRINTANGIVNFTRYSGDTTGIGFPLSGYRLYSSGSPNQVGSYGSVWSSAAYSRDSAHLLYFGTYTLSPQDDSYRAGGFSVRPVEE